MDKDILKEIMTSNDIISKIKEQREMLENILPIIKIMYNYNQNHPHHNLDLWNHTLHCLSLSSNDYIVRLSLLLHDIGKPYSVVEGEVNHYPNHGIIGANMSKEILTNIDINEELIEKIYFMIKYHDTDIGNIKNDVTKDILEKLYEVQYCDAHSHNPMYMDKRLKYLKKAQNIISQKK